jgi:2-keto-myo-inositol isomerase
MPFRGLALHTWTLDTTPLAPALRAARTAGWDAVELRRLDFMRAAEAGRSAEDVIADVKASGLAVACVGAEFGWMFAEGEERQRLLRVMDEQCRHAARLGCTTVMSPSDRGRGPLERAVAGIREVGDIAATHGITLAIEYNSQAEQFNRLDVMREALAKAGHPRSRLLLDTYHLLRSGGSVRDVEDIGPDEIAYVQFSDVPATGLVPGKALDRLPPGRGVVPFREVFAAIVGRGYGGYVSYEAPNPDAWSRDPTEVAREALEATRPFLPR